MRRIGRLRAQLQRVRTTWLNSQVQVIQNRFAHFTQVMRGKGEPRVSGVHGYFKRKDGGAVEDVRGMFKGFTQWNPGVDTEHLQMVFALAAVCEGLDANGGC